MTAIDANGVSIAAGARVPLAPELAFTFDVGYALIGGASTAQDRWWLIPSLAFVAPAGDVRFDLGAGIGLAAASGYSSLTRYADAPFDPERAYQLVPTGFTSRRRPKSRRTSSGSSAPMQRASF